MLKDYTKAKSPKINFHYINYMWQILALLKKVFYNVIKVLKPF